MRGSIVGIIERFDGGIVERVDGGISERIDGKIGERIDGRIGERVSEGINGAEHQWRNGTAMEHTGSQVDSRGRCEGTASIVSRKGWYFFLVGQMYVVH